MNLRDLNIGSITPLGKKIKDFVFRSDDLIVYIDEEDMIQWFRISNDSLPENFGEINNKVSDWESKINKVFKKKEAYGYKFLLADAFTRILFNNDINQARDLIERVAVRVEKQGKELLKQYYAISTLVFTIFNCILIWISKYNQTYIEKQYGRLEYEIWMTMLFGGIGAFIFTIVRLRKYEADIEISSTIHIVDGFLRIFYGVIFGLAMAIAIKSNLLLGFLNNIDKSIYVSIFLGICAGASEIIIPSLIKQIETKSK